MRFTLGLVGVAALLAFVSCSSLTSPTAAPPRSHFDLENDPSLLPIHFSGYHAFFVWLADGYGLATDDDSIAKLAAECKVETLDWKPGRTLTRDDEITLKIVKATWLEGVADSLRVGQDNGGYYVLHPLREGLDLVGQLHGNYYHYSNNEFLASWHISASGHIESIYRWDGEKFKEISSKEVMLTEGGD